jgi:transposase InsO family protein
MEDRTHDGRKIHILNVVDEFTRECLAIRVGRRLNSTDVIDVLSDLFILYGVPGHIRSDNGLRREAGYSRRQQISVH